MQAQKDPYTVSLVIIACRYDVLTNSNVHRSQEMEESAHVYKSTPMDIGQEEPSHVKATPIDMGQEEQAHVHEVITTGIGMDEEMEEHVYEEIIELQYMEKSSGRNVSQKIENKSGDMSAALPATKSQQPQLYCPVNIHTRLSPLKQEIREKTPPLPPKPGILHCLTTSCVYTSVITLTTQMWLHLPQYPFCHLNLHLSQCPM